MEGSELVGKRKVEQDRGEEVFLLKLLHMDDLDIIINYAALVFPKHPLKMYFFPKSMEWGKLSEI